MDPETIFFICIYLLALLVLVVPAILGDFIKPEKSNQTTDNKLSETNNHLRYVIIIVCLLIISVIFLHYKKKYATWLFIILTISMILCLLGLISYMAYVRDNPHTVNMQGSLSWTSSPYLVITSTILLIIVKVLEFLLSYHDDKLLVKIFLDE